MRNIIALLVLLFAALSPCMQTPAVASNTRAPVIIIKVDDLKSDAHGGVPERWQRFADYIKEHKLHASIGIICDSLNE